MSGNKYTWDYDETNEIWLHDMFNNIEDCEKDAKDNYDMEIGEIICVGECIPFEPYVDSENVLEYLMDNAYDQCGEASESWQPDKVNKEKIEELDMRLTEVVKIWMEENHVLPDFYSINNIRKVKIK